METDRFQTDAVLVARLMKLALTGEHRQFEYIRNWGMRRLAADCAKTTKRVVKYFKACKDNTDRLVKYELMTDRFDVRSVGMAIRFDECIAFYEEELRILKSMLSEHLRYMLSFHLIDTFVLNRWRPDRECFDHRRIFGKM